MAWLNHRLSVETYRHRVVRGYSIPEDVPLMAERFQAAGWSTVGVLYSSLSGDLGPHRGFQQFLDEGLKPGLPVTFLTAPEVTQRTLDVLDSYGDSEQDLFLFVQYSDAHMPWLRAEHSDSLAPDSIRNQHVDPQYNGPIVEVYSLFKDSDRPDCPSNWCLQMHARLGLFTSSGQLDRSRDRSFI